MIKYIALLHIFHMQCTILQKEGGLMYCKQQIYSVSRGFATRTKKPFVLYVTTTINKEGRFWLRFSLFSRRAGFKIRVISTQFSPSVSGEFIDSLPS
jgi:hypothetical protein